MRTKINFRKAFFIVGALMAGASGCQKAALSYTEADYRRQVDSTLQLREPEIIRQFDTDLDRRMSIEVRPLADSLAR